jgi:hypothetical protein
MYTTRSTAAGVLNAASAPLENPTRRRAIGLVGGGVVLASAALAGCSSAFPDDAVQAWQATPDASDLRRYMLAHALLAPNPHNRQPWLADLRRDGEISLVCDKDRLLPETDPFGRQILIGCGAFIELAVIAAAERGFAVEVLPFPDGEPAPQALPGGRVVARLVLKADAALPRDPLFAQIRRRHTNKAAYDSSRAVPAALLQQLVATAQQSGLLAGEIVAPERVAAVRQVARAAFETEMSTPRTWLESAHLLRIGPAEIEKHRDGISLMGLMPRVMSSIGVFDRFEVPVRGTSNFSRVTERFQAEETGSGYFWIASRGNSRRSQLDAGRAYVRAHLQATAASVDMHPQSQSIQEFAEVRSQFNALHQLLGFDPAQVTVQMLARVGYGTVAARGTPRRDLAGLVLA